MLLEKFYRRVCRFTVSAFQLSNPGAYFHKISNYKNQKQANCLQSKSYEGLLLTYKCYYRSPKGQRFTVTLNSHLATKIGQSSNSDFCVSIQY